jgi:hypothetical protein
MRKTVKGQPKQAPSQTSPTASSASLTLTLRRPITMSALQDHRRSFTKMANMLSLKGSAEVTRSFVDFMKSRV